MRPRAPTARELRNGVQISALVLTINEQAYEARTRTAQGLLDEALKVDAASTITVTNLAVLTIDRGE
jgi:hypothetical protein